MFYLIGLGLEKKAISLESLEICKRASKIYIEKYTSKFPYAKKDLEKLIKRKIILLDREKIEDESFLLEAKKKDIVLLVYGSPLIATTHISLILRCKKENIKYKIIHNSSIYDAITETGLQIYKFGKTTSLPKWEENYKPKSFLNIIKENKKINSHTLILVDPKLRFKEAIEQLEKSGFKGKIIIGEMLGIKGNIYYEKISQLKNKKIRHPFCFIIPAKLHFFEKEALDLLSKNKL